MFYLLLVSRVFSLSSCQDVKTEIATNKYISWIYLVACSYYVH